ncbi:polyamine aminopropyltransferase [Novimethylophilus kurashikiensis]|uniref:Polyamine aminopropyltransferase n=1 Tax=Novimethylophilus kurashikiensis TaxID=1825523 RepID=A0A2R5F9H7_9PROT|nr:methyltransferase domain-containing protein [Novimethylophilus kurashikiensis]GBG13341.1 polyamine aminopropyltransferase [Novimethylophilus kurashikiensis]
MKRMMEPEWLDELPADDPRAQGSRRDLQRLNRIMGHIGLMQNMLERYGRGRGRLVELGGGDGTFLLALVRAMKAPPGHIVLVDRQPAVRASTLQAFDELGWQVDIMPYDIFVWMAKLLPTDLLLCNLFLHHLPDHALAELFDECANRALGLIALEPARQWTALMASRCVGFIGCNAVTRHDAVASVKAGFVGQELSTLWPKPAGWHLKEQHAGLFSHAFAARRL